MTRNELYRRINLRNLSFSDKEVSRAYKLMKLALADPPKRFGMSQQAREEEALGRAIEIVLQERDRPKDQYGSNPFKGFDFGHDDHQDIFSFVHDQTSAFYKAFQVPPDFFKTHVDVEGEIRKARLREEAERLKRTYGGSRGGGKTDYMKRAMEDYARSQPDPVWLTWDEVAPGPAPVFPICPHCGKRHPTNTFNHSTWSSKMKKDHTDEEIAKMKDVTADIVEIKTIHELPHKS